MDQRRPGGRPPAGTAPPHHDETGSPPAPEANGDERVADEASSLADDAVRSLQEQASAQVRRAAGHLRGVGAQLHALAEGRTDDAADMSDHAHRAGDEIDRFADRLEHRGFDGLVADVGDLARRRPGLFVAGATVAGLVVGQLARPREPGGAQDTDARAADVSRAPKAGSETTDGNGDRRR